MRDLTLKRNNLNKFGDLYFRFYSLLSQPYRQDRNKISTAAPCLCVQGTSIFKLNTVPFYWKSDHTRWRPPKLEIHNISACTLDRNTIPNPKPVFHLSERSRTPILGEVAIHNVCQSYSKETMHPSLWTRQSLF